jgi:hypothetical protein
VAHSVVRCFAATRRLLGQSGLWQAVRQQIYEFTALVAPHDGYGLLCAVSPRNRHDLRGAARHVRTLGRYDSRRIPMCPIPGNVICIGVAHIAGRRLPNVYQGLAIRRIVEKAPYSRQKGSYPVSPVMPERGQRRMGNRMRGSKHSTARRSRSGECLVRGKHKRYYAERRDKRPIHFIRHGGYQFVGC